MDTYMNLSPREQILSIDPEAVFGRSARPGQQEHPAVLLSTSVRQLDLPVLRSLAASIAYETHTQASAAAAKGSRCTNSWFIPDEVPEAA